jgi:leucyl aminopeptidase
MEYVTTTSAAPRRAGGCIVVGLYEGERLGAAAADIDAASGGLLTKLAQQGDLSPKPGRCTVLTAVPGVRAQRVAVAGLGKISKFDVGTYRKAVAASIHAIRASKVGAVTVYLSLEEIRGIDVYYKARYTVETVGHVLYSFTEMKSARSRKRPGIRSVGIAVAERRDVSRARLGAEHGDAVVYGSSLCRDLGNLPPNVCTPSYLARSAQKLARQHRNLDTRILGEKEMKRHGMGALLSVTAGTVEPARLIVMTYKGAGKAQPVVLVGKGVTFDSGGISLKPGPAMDEMKFDMCGAASVIGTMATVAKLQLPVNLTVVVPAVENLPSGTATRPGDIVTSMSGQTIEILNTDAEGRLILCDALTYSKRFKPSLIVDVATLTGACVIALGHHRTAVMSRDDATAARILEAGIAADDRAWQLPLADEYGQQLKSNFADFANVGGREGGAITAACFLARFTDGMNWAHLDIAGTAWRSGAHKGATGRPVPLLCQLLLDEAGVLP